MLDLANPEMRTTSMTVADVFGKQHAHILRAIYALPSDTTEARAFNRSNFGAIDFLDGRGRTQKGIAMTRDGFTLLAMGFTGSKAHAWKLKYLAAFNAMEAQLVKQHSNLEWAAARVNIKQVRRSFTDVVARFVEYAKGQGSESAERYFANLTKMEYKALGLLEMQKTAIGNFRDTLDLMDIAYLHVAEMTAQAAIEEGIEAGTHYKEIYQLAKQRVEAYANVVAVSRPSKYKSITLTQ